jgi:5-(carboxyamino)imidazole ribonucleotide synthase
MKLGSKIGILGGGQLSMMLNNQAQDVTLEVHSLTPSKLDPASLVSPHTFLGDPKNAADLLAFTQNLDFLTFESEFYNAQYLKKTLCDFKGMIFPSLDCLELLQDRKSQKTSFEKNKLDTSPFIHTQNINDIENFFKQGPLVAKQRFNGYDGFGTFVLNTKTDLENFLDKNHQQLDLFIFEKKIAFQYEVAIQAARSRKGHTVFFPFVKTIQKNNKCFLVEGPEKSTLAFLQIKKKIQKYLDKIDYVGVIGFEFFKTRNSLILNEVAPRVHNTGHHTLDSCDVDQFLIHLLCALQDRLPLPKMHAKAFTMLNLIGTRDGSVEIPDLQSGRLYWYGKSNRAGRKLGHINFIGENKKALTTLALKELKRWKI